MLIPLSKLLYFENREKKWNAKTHHTVRIRCVSCGDRMFCLCRRQTVYSNKTVFNSLKLHFKNKKEALFQYFPPPCQNILWILPVFRYACCSLEALPLGTFLTQAYRHVKLASCLRHWSWSDTVLYTFTNNQQVLLVKTHQRPTSHVVTTSGQSFPLQSYLCSASSVSAAKPLMIRTCTWPIWVRAGV